MTTLLANPGVKTLMGFRRLDSATPMLNGVVGAVTGSEELGSSSDAMGNFLFGGFADNADNLLEHIAEGLGRYARRAFAFSSFVSKIPVIGIIAKPVYIASTIGEGLWDAIINKDWINGAFRVGAGISELTAFAVAGPAGGAAVSMILGSGGIIKLSHKTAFKGFALNLAKVGSKGSFAKKVAEHCSGDPQKLFKLMAHKNRSNLAVMLGISDLKKVDKIRKGVMGAYRGRYKDAMSIFRQVEGKAHKVIEGVGGKTVAYTKPFGKLWGSFKKGRDAALGKAPKSVNNTFEKAAKQIEKGRRKATSKVAESLKKGRAKASGTVTKSTNKVAIREARLRRAYKRSQARTQAANLRKAKKLEAQKKLIKQKGAENYAKEQAELAAKRKEFLKQQVEKNAKEMKQGAALTEQQAKKRIADIRSRMKKAQSKASIEAKQQKFIEEAKKAAETKEQMATRIQRMQAGRAKDAAKLKAKQEKIALRKAESKKRLQAMINQRQGVALSNA